MIPVFVLSALGLGLTVFYLIYRQVYGNVVITKLRFAIHLIVFAIIYSLMLLLGYLLAISLVPMMHFTPQWISMGLFFFLGMKMYRQVVKGKSQQWIFDTTNFRILLLYCLSGGFDAFFAGIGLGFFMEYEPVYLFLFALSLMIFMLLAFIMARRKSATLSVWLFATFGASLLGMNAIVILLYLLFG